MAEDFVTFDNRFMVLHNPLPPITVEELHKLAKVTLRKRKQGARQVFDIELRYGGGEDLKTHTLRPGQSIRMPERVAREIIQDFKPAGGEICGCNPGLAAFRDDSERQTAIIDALQIAENHYHVIGAGQLDCVRLMRGHRDDEVERFRSSIYATYYLAMAKEEVIRETRERIERGEDRPQRKAS